jgi:hypothetical protein
MNCLSLVSFAIIMNGLNYTFFRCSKGLRQGCSLVPIPFFIIVEGLNRAIIEEKIIDNLKGINIVRSLNLNHLIFVDDVLIFGGQ